MTHYFKSKGTRVMSQTPLSGASDPKWTDYTGGALWTYPLNIQPNGSNDAIVVGANDIIIYSCATPLGGTQPYEGWAQPYTNVANQTLYYWLFSPFSEYTSSTNVGLQLFNADSTLAYDSGQKPLKMVYKGTNLTLSASMNTSLGLPAGRTYAAMMPTQSIRMYNPYVAPTTMEPHPPENGSEMGFKITGGQVYLNEVFGHAMYATSNSNISQGSIFVFDVTGY